VPDVYVRSEPFEIRPAGSPHHNAVPVRPSLTTSSDPDHRARTSSNNSISGFSGHSGGSVASASVSAQRIDNGKVTHFTFEYGGPYVAGLLAAGLLCDGFKHSTLQEFEQGTADGWVKLGEPGAGKKGKFVVAEHVDGEAPMGTPLIGSPLLCASTLEDVPALQAAGAARGHAEGKAKAREDMPVVVEEAEESAVLDGPCRRVHRGPASPTLVIGE
jgi:hypothetical protein